jgi:large subunit ribosomal protein L10
MNRDQKAAVVDEIAGQLQDAQAIFAVDYRGISVSEIAELRDKLRDSDTRFRIVKNSLSERAADKAGAESLKPLLEGPTALALVRGDAALAAKALNDTARALNNILEFKGGVMDGATLSADDIRSIARLPAREVLHGQLVGTIAAPITGLARGLNALIAGVAIQLRAIADQGLVSGEAPTSTEAEDAPAESEAQSPPEVTEPPPAPEGPPPEEPAAEEPAAEEAPAAEGAEQSTESESEPETEAASDADSSDE